MDTKKPFTPADGELVRYHGSLTQHHGVWRVRGVVEFGGYAGRTVLESIVDPRETLTISPGNATISPVD